jgi:3-deoxy-D-manno-octulosonate 8-phosphate phosphatase (KDO 8-P phosphatase)
VPAWSEETRQRAARVRVALFDVDGVMTDGRLYYGADGETLKVFHSRDGQGLAMLRACGYEFGVISGRQSEAVTRRLLDLGARHIHQGCTDKLAALQAILRASGARAEQVAFLGDDLPDLAVLAAVGLAVAVADADPRVAAACHFRTERRGGDGAVRELCELLLEARGLGPGANGA